MAKTRLRQTAVDFINDTWPVLAMWTVLLAVALVYDANWPNGRQWEVFAALAVWLTFNVYLATIMLRLMHEYDGLTVALAVALLAKASVPLYFMGVILWPTAVTEHRGTIVRVVAVMIVLILGSAIVVIKRTPRNGYQRGVAAGVAQEKSDQHDREVAAGYD